MVRTRPTIVLVMAILTIVFGSIWTLVSLCSGVWVLLFYTIQAPQLDAALKPMRELSELLQKEAPGYLAMEVTNYALRLVLSVLFIFSGIGLLRMKVWAWRTSVISSAATVVWEIVHTVYQWIYVNPVTARWTEELMHKQPAGTPNFAALSENSAMKVIIAGAALVFSVGFPVVLLVVMFLPNVRAAFSRPVPGKEHPDDSIAKV